MGVFGPPDIGKVRAKGNAKGLIAVEPLVAALQDLHPHERGAAAVALGLTGEPAVDPVLSAFNNECYRKGISSSVSGMAEMVAWAAELAIVSLGRWQSSGLAPLIHRFVRSKRT